ncbi:ABC transporter permease [Anaerobacillus sp. CMMVII]|uniref:ABC transporter permease n=1 Tax=Anaerobacillus sp. CMMVII TaxID=2755588 RepID=UPI0021B78D14|nr:ABC transporter permease [Anaerobacillus sp. CMMVII]MCT8139430.1 ABC transporter permease [Anaerobacillus sp. CMMVII]
MKAYWQLTLAQLKLFARNKAVIFWTTFFPLFLMIVLGLFLGGGTGTTISVAWVDHDKSNYSLMMMDTFIEVEAIDLHEADDVEAAKLEVEEGNISFVIEIEQGFGQIIEAGGGVPTFSVFYDETNQAIAQLGFAIIDQAVDQLNKQLTDFQEIVFVEKQGIKSLDLTYLDFLVPGIAALMILSSNLNGVAAQISSWRERGVLRRMKLTGLPASTFVAAQITARAILNITQSILVLSVGIFLLGAQMNGNWFLLLFYLILGILVFMSLGFLVANLAKTPEHASPIAGFISFPMFFLGGIFFPITNMPEFLQPIITLIPISHLAGVLREVMNVGATMVDLFLPTTILVAWFLVCFITASRTFKWE